jgi:hypothetical protein
LEEESCFVFNICYCFFCPLVFSKKTLSDDDIPVCDTRDRTEVHLPKVKSIWMKSYIEYIKKLAEYENSNPSGKMKEPKKPSLIFAVFCGIFNLSALLGLILLLIRYLFCTVVILL